MLRGPWNPVCVFRRRRNVVPSPPQAPFRGCLSLATSSGNFHGPCLFLLPTLCHSCPPDTTIRPSGFSPVIIPARRPGSSLCQPQRSVLCSLSISFIVMPSLAALFSSRQKLHVPRFPLLVTQLPWAIYSTAVSSIVYSLKSKPFSPPIPFPQHSEKNRLKLPVRAGKPQQPGGGGLETDESVLNSGPLRTWEPSHPLSGTFHLSPSLLPVLWHWLILEEGDRQCAGEF